MKIKRMGKQIFGAELTANELKALKIEIGRQLAEMEWRHANELDALVLYALYKHTGWGKKRLRDFYDAFTVEHEKLIAHYEMPDDNAWLAEVKLKEIGVDVAAWNAEQEASNEL